VQSTKEPKYPLDSPNSEPPALPCLNSNISIGEGPAGGQVQGTPLAALSTQHKKSAAILRWSVEKMAQTYGLETLGFLTLTFREHILCPREAQRRLNSLLTNVIKDRYHSYLGVMERQKSGRIHYHLLIALPVDIRTGFQFDQVAKQNYSSAGQPLRDEWSFWRKTAPAYGFGRTELLPIKSTVEAIAKYVGKYIAKHMEARNPDDKGVRLVRYARNARVGTTRFQFQSTGAAEWRRKLCVFAQIIQERHPELVVASLSDLSKVLGKRWAYNHRTFILNLP